MCRCVIPDLWHPARSAAADYQQPLSITTLPRTVLPPPSVMFQNEAPAERSPLVVEIIGAK